MNEIAALLTFVYFTETPEKKGTNKSHIGHLYDSFMCESDAEADIFALFDKILKNGHAEMFTNQKTVPSILSVYKSSNLSDKHLSVVLLRCKKIFDYLGYIDKDIHAKFKIFNIEPQIFLLRWIRCFFTREFHLQDSLTLIDAIFYDFFLDERQNPFALIDCICISMIVFIKPSIMETDDEIFMLQRLMKYPPIESFFPIISQAFAYKQNLRSINEELEHLQQEKELQKKENQKKEIILFNNTLEQPSLIYTNDKKMSKTPQIEFESKDDLQPKKMTPKKPGKHSPPHKQEDPLPIIQQEDRYQEDLYQEESKQKKKRSPKKSSPKKEKITPLQETKETSSNAAEHSDDVHALTELLKKALDLSLTKIKDPELTTLMEASLDIAEKLQASKPSHRKSLSQH